MRKINKLGYLLVFIIPISIITAYYSGSVYSLMVLPFLIFVALPILDPALGLDENNFTQEEASVLKEEKYYRNITILWAFVQTSMMLWLVYIFTFHELSTSTIILLLVNTMIMNGGVGITVAHELGHKSSKFEKFLAKLLLVQTAYGHFYVEHNRGHHVHIGTPMDPATGKKNQSYYSFWVQTVFKGFKSSIILENNRLKAKKMKINLWNHEVYRLSIISILLFISAMMYSYYINSNINIPLAIFLILQAILSFSILEAVNYIEHYGIQRREISENVYEKVNPKHSWNANFIYSNYLLFQLQRHADHHLFASKRYQILNNYNESPQLPNGYPAMVILTLVPSLWFKVMNKRLEQWQNKNG